MDLWQVQLTTLIKIDRQLLSLLRGPPGSGPGPVRLAKCIRSAVSIVGLEYRDVDAAPDKEIATQANGRQLRRIQERGSSTGSGSDRALEAATCGMLVRRAPPAQVITAAVAAAGICLRSGGGGDGNTRNECVAERAVVRKAARLPAVWAVLQGQVHAGCACL